MTALVSRLRNIAVLVACSALAGCPKAASPPPPVVSAGLAWSYEVDARDLDLIAIEATIAPGGSSSFGLDEDALAYVHDLEGSRDDGATWARVPPEPDGFTVGCDSGCRLRYKFALREAARAIHDPETAALVGDAVIAPPTTWLLHPDHAPKDARFRFQVVVSANDRFVSATHATADGAYEDATDHMDSETFAAFGAIREHPIVLGGSTIDVAIGPASLPLGDEAIVRWVTADAKALVSYFGEYPVPRVTLFVMPAPKVENHGVTLGDGGPGIVLGVGSKFATAPTDDDWVVTHEMLHVAFPSLRHDHAWLYEGLASYIEPFIRARAGLTTDVKVWSEMMHGLPKGLPQDGDGGLEGADRFERIYWGGALFSALGDVGVRERTNDAKSLDDALRAVLQESGGVESHWELDRTLEAMDRATGTDVFTTLAAKMKDAPYAFDLDLLWKKLGVVAEGNSVRFDDSAPLAAIRKSMTKPF